MLSPDISRRVSRHYEFNDFVVLSKNICDALGYFNEPTWSFKDNGKTLLSSWKDLNCSPYRVIKTDHYRTFYKQNI